MEPVNNPQQPPPPPGGKSGETLVYCKLQGGSIIITTLTHCTVILKGTDVGKVPPEDTPVVACKIVREGAEHVITTTASDCTGPLAGTVQVGGP